MENLLMLVYNQLFGEQLVPIQQFLREFANTFNLSSGGG